MEEQEKKPEYSVDLTELDISDEISELTQEGSYLCGITQKGVHFRQFIPEGKILNKKDGKWVFEKRIISDIADSL